MHMVLSNELTRGKQLCLNQLIHLSQLSIHNVDIANWWSMEHESIKFLKTLSIHGCLNFGGSWTSTEEDAVKNLNLDPWPGITKLNMDWLGGGNNDGALWFWRRFPKVTPQKSAKNGYLLT